MLAVDAGYTYVMIAEMLLIDEGMARRYVKTYKEGGLEGLTENHYEGSPGKLLKSEIVDLKAWIGDQTPNSTRQVQAFFDGRV